MKRKLIAVIMLLICGINGFSQKNIKFIPDVLKQGEMSTIIYDNRSTTLSGLDPIEGVIYFWEDYKWRADDLKLTKNDSVWIAQYIMPDNASLAVIIFHSGDKTDKGNKYTYCQSILDKSCKSTPSARIGWGMLRNKTMSEYSIPGFCDSINSIDDDVMRFWINQELLYNPSERSKIFHICVDFLEKINIGEEELREIAKREVDYILSLKNTDENQLLNAMDISFRILKDQDKTKEIDSLIKKRFPFNITHRDEMILQAFREVDYEKKKSILDEILKYYPTEKYRDINTPNSNLYYGKVLQSIIYNGITNNQDYSLLDKYLHDSPMNQLVTYYWHLVQLAYRDKHLPVEELLSISSKIIFEMKNRPRVGVELTFSPKQWSEYFYVRYKEIMMTHMALLLANKSNKEALEIAEKILPYFENKSTDFNDLYIKILSDNGYDNLIIPHIKLSVEQNAATPEMLELLKNDYIKNKGSEEGFDLFLLSIKSFEDSRNMEKQLKNSLIKKQIELFMFEEMNGSNVDMASQKGKIIVIDFWATWCAPCKAALPGMQLAVNKYKSDTNVVFYFIATQENKPGFKDELRKYVKEKGYNITVLFDNLDSTGKVQDAYNIYSKTFGFSGIPHKMIIDGNGYLRWSSTGYNGSPSRLADEICYLIELIKKEDNNRTSDEML